MLGNLDPREVRSTLSSRQSVPGLSKERLESLTDGIFATVMTVLVLSLSVPVITGGARMLKLLQISRL